MQHLIEGLDPTGQEFISISDALQMVRAAKPFTGQGWIIWDENAPDVLENPELSTFLWGKLVDDVPNREFYYYDGASWSLLPLVDGNLLAENTVGLNKLKRDGTQAFDILQINAANDALIYISIPNAIQNGSLHPVKLTAPDDIGDYVLTSLAGVKAFTFLAALANRFTDNSIAINKLVRGGANTLLRTNPTATGLQWTTIDVSDLLAAGSSAGQSIRRNPGNTGWQYFTPDAPILTQLAAPPQVAQPIPAGFGTLQFPHGFGAKPKLVRVVLLCEISEMGYNVGDEVEISSAFHHNASSDDHNISVATDTTNINVTFYSDPLFVLSRLDGDATPLVRGNWSVKVYTYA